MKNAVPDPKTQRRLAFEARTVRAMMRIYCRDHHGGDSLCPDCQALLEYSEKRVSRCPHGIEKPNCKDCPIHCFREPQRSEIHAVMRYAGPRMLGKHPIMALHHLYVQWRRRKVQNKNNVNK